MTRPSARAAIVAGLLAYEAVVVAHSGPPFPIVSDRAVGAYKISIWTDPDTTDDGRAAGQFWVTLDPADQSKPIPDATRATVAIRPLDRSGPTRTDRGAPVNGEVGRQFVALLMDHEGPFAVQVVVDGPLGRAAVDSQVDATYDLRPARGLLALYLFPFVAIGALWAKVLLARRRSQPPRS